MNNKSDDQPQIDDVDSLDLLRLVLVVHRFHLSRCDLLDKQTSQTK